MPTFYCLLFGTLQSHGTKFVRAMVMVGPGVKRTALCVLPGRVEHTNASALAE